jgi:predicted phosphoadenosine phosphosulfate sulfurtransferase
MQSGRAPSYKAIALAILRNDLHMYSLGFSTPSYERQLEIVERARLLTGAQSLNSQLDLFKVSP